LKPFQAFVIPKLVKKKALTITPFRDKESLMQALMQTSEYRSFKIIMLFNHGFDDKP
jgi:DNA mismatch repair protein MutS2